MPEPLERSEFLARVAESVDLQPEEVGDVLEELNSHLSDAAAGWREAGYEPDDAERRAIRGLGDPEALGRELGRARHRTRRLLAAAGGGVFNALAFGLWSWLTIWLLVAGVVVCAMFLAHFLLQLQGGQLSNWFTGPLASAGTVLVNALWMAWIGWVLPGRVAIRAGRSVRGVRRAVAIAGTVGISALMWTVPTLTLDWVMAIGLPLCPLAFLWAALHATGDEVLFPRSRARTRLAVFAATVLAVTGAGFLTVAPASNDGGWSFDTRAIGVDAWSDPLLAGLQVQPGGYSNDTAGVRQDSATVSITDGTPAASIARRYSTLQLEVWPASVRDGAITVGARPLATASVPFEDGATVTLDWPSYRTPVEAVSATVLIGADGSRALEGVGAVGLTPSVHATLLDWWLRSR